MEEKKVLDIIAEFTTYSPDELNESMNFIDDLGIDSLDLAQIMLSVESEFDLEFDEELAENIETIGDALNLLREKLDEESH